jgi:hypothetical protein
LIAFVAHQYYTLQDNLISTLLSSVQAAENTAAREHKDWCYAERKSQAVKLKARIAAFEAHFATAMATLKQVFDAKNLSDSDKLASLELLLFPVDDAPVLSDEILRGMKEDADLTGDDGAQYYKFLEGKSRRLQNRAAGVLKTLSFQAETHVNPLFAALGHFQKCGGAVTRTAPVTFLDPAERAAVGAGDAFRPSLYKVLLFQRIAHPLDRHTRLFRSGFRRDPFSRDRLCAEDQISQAPNPVRISVDVPAGPQDLGGPTAKVHRRNRRARPLGGHFEVGGHHQAEKGHGLRHFSAAEFLLQAERPLHRAQGLRPDRQNPFHPAIHR